jgi:hypothetical protein
MPANRPWRGAQRPAMPALRRGTRGVGGAPQRRAQPAPRLAAIADTRAARRAICEERQAA